MRKATAAGSWALGVALLLAGGCATGRERADRSGDPPAPYKSWDEYWKAEDQRQRDFENDAMRHDMERQRVHGVPR